MASIKRIKASDGSGNASVATVTVLRAANATTQHVDTVAGIYAGSEGFYATMGTPHTFTDPVTGETITEISEASAVNFQGHIDTGNIIIDAIEPGYTDAGSKVGDIVIIRPTTSWADNVADVLAEAHDDDGKLKAAVPVTNATALTVEPLTGWINDPNTFTYVSGTGTITAVFKVSGVDVTDHLQVGMPFVAVQGGVNKYGFITKLAFSTDTTITALMAATNGTVDNSGIANATITSFKFGLPKQPGFGFPLDPAKWNVIQTGSGSGSITVPIACNVLFTYHDNLLGGTTSGHDYYSTFAVDGTTEINLHRRTATTASGSDNVDSQGFAIVSLTAGSHTITVTSIGTGSWMAEIKWGLL